MNGKIDNLTDVELFLKDLRNILTNKEFNVNTDLDILMKKKTQRSRGLLYNSKYITRIKL